MAWPLLPGPFAGPVGPNRRREGLSVPCPHRSLSRRSMFFPQYAPTTSDWVLVAELAIGLTLLAGMFVVRAGHVRAHKYLQSAMVLVNVPLVLALMLPTYLKDVAP